MGGSEVRRKKRRVGVKSVPQAKEFRLVLQAAVPRKGSDRIRFL